MTKAKLSIAFLFLAFMIMSCNFNSKELIDLRNEIRYLETEISSIQSAPGYMFGEAFEYIDAKDYNEAVDRLTELHDAFPEWNSEIVENYLIQYSKLVTSEENADPE